MNEDESALLRAARELLSNAEALEQSSGAMAEKLWAMRHRFTHTTFSADAELAAYTLGKALHREWMRHRY